MRLSLVAAVAALPLAACVEPPKPVVSDYNGASVKIVDYSAGMTEANQAEATRICRAGGKGRAEYASSLTNNQTYQTEHLYLCL